MIRAENLTKSYVLQGRRHYVFKDLSFTIPERTNLGILGVNGSGKTTLLRILGGMDFPDSGEIHSDCNFSWPLGLRGGFVDHMSGRNNCKMICQIYGMDSHQLPKALDKIQDLSGVGDFFNDPVKTYSSGMKSRVAFALSMAFDFDYFILDEITAVGDKNFKKTAMAALEEKRQNSKVLMASHQLSTLKDFCDSGIVLHKGEVQYFEQIGEAIDYYNSIA
jgi:capsular polysaccharide transport system ATP-binding protein